MEVNKIHNEDCLKTMNGMDDKSVDLTLTDFPYGVDIEYDSFHDTQQNLKELIDKVMPEILRVSKRALITIGHTNIWHYPPSNWILGWVNKAGNNRNSWGFTCWQPILAYGKDPFLANGMGARQDIIENIESSPKNGHPCPKPIKFWVKLLLRGSVKETDIIYDPFMGSGTTAIACIKTDRHYIGSEISEEYCKIAEKRIAQELSQLKLSL